MPGRNEPCPCGSGKKYKHCCLLRDSRTNGAANRLGQPENEDAFAAEDPELAAWKRADKEMIRRGMERIERVEEDLLALMEQYWGEGSVEYWKQNGITEGELQQFNCWMWLDWRPPPGHPTIAEQMTTDASQPEMQRQILASLSSSHPSVYQIVRLDPGRGAELENVLEGGRVFVHDRIASTSAKKWGLFFARVYSAGPYHFIAAGSYLFPPSEKEFIREYLTTELSEHQAACPGSSWEQFLKARADVFGPLTLELWERAEQPPRLCNADGDPLVFWKVELQVANPEVFLSKLRGHRDLDEDPESGEGLEFVWFRRKDDRLLGRIVMNGSVLILECNSRARMEKGLRLLRKFGSVELIRKEEMDEEQIWENVRNRPGQEAEEPEELPDAPTEAQAYLREYISRHYQEWVEQPLPALNGMTPRQAAADPRAREKLVDLIRSMEYTDSERDLHDPLRHDWNQMRRYLGLPSE